MYAVWPVNRISDATQTGLSMYVVRRLANAVLAHDLCNGHAGFAFLQHRQDLRLGEL